MLKQTGSVQPGYRMRILASVLMTVIVAGCSTRQVSDTLEGSTAQRLVTYSLEKFIADLVSQPELSLTNHSVHLQVHFLADHPMADYATRLLTAQLEMTHSMQVKPANESADFQVDVFFNSIGTDRDDFGLTVPSLGLFTGVDSRIELLAIDMFHGITEGHAMIRPLTGDPASHSVSRTERILTRIRRDKVSTPILELPWGQFDL